MPLQSRPRVAQAVAEFPALTFQFLLDAEVEPWLERGVVQRFQVYALDNPPRGPPRLVIEREEVASPRAVRLRVIGETEHDFAQVAAAPQRVRSLAMGTALELFCELARYEVRLVGRHNQERLVHDGERHIRRDRRTAVAPTSHGNVDLLARAVILAGHLYRYRHRDAGGLDFHASGTPGLVGNAVGHDHRVYVDQRHVLLFDVDGKRTPVKTFRRRQLNPADL